MGCGSLPLDLDQFYRSKKHLTVIRVIGKAEKREIPANTLVCSLLNKTDSMNTSLEGIRARATFASSTWHA